MNRFINLQEDNDRHDQNVKDQFKLLKEQSIQN